MLLLGAPFAGKSALAVAFARCVSTGQDFFGRRVRRGAVIYVAIERYDETDMRLEVAVRDDNDPPLRLAKVRLYAETTDADRLAAAMNDLAFQVALAPALIIFDTVNAILRDGGGDENSSRDINKLTLAIDSVRETTGAAVIVIHHAKRGEKRSRGSEALEGWADVVAMVDGKAAQRKLTVIRSNTVEEGVKATFSLLPVDIGEDAETGTRSAVVLAVPAQRSSREVTPQPIRLSPDVEIAFAELQKLGDPASFKEWRTKTMLAFAERQPGAKRQAFLNAKTQLLKEHLIAIDDQDDQNVSVSRPSA